MNTIEAKRIRIVDYLRLLGHEPVKVRGGQYWYPSPLRKEDTPSFKVNDRLNEWYDFGLSEGGSIIELAMLFLRTSSVSEVLRLIEVQTGAAPLLRTRPHNAMPDAIEEMMKGVEVVPLNHHALLSYIHSRGIDTQTARQFCREIHYELHRRHYFAIAFGNVSGGYEMRNPYYKGCIGQKDISVVEQAAGTRQKHVNVFEGFMDFLSYRTLLKRGDAVVCIQAPCDHIVMNTVSNLKKTLQVLESYEYIHCYLDNDLAGQKTVETIAGLYGIGRTVNEAVRYADYKDLNDCLRGRKR